MTEISENLIEGKVKSYYGNIAQELMINKNACCLVPAEKETGSCCEDSCGQVTQEKSHRDTSSLGCDLRLLEVADPQKGEVVLDFGSGPGHDSRKIANHVGTQGMVIGIDFLLEMTTLAESKAEGISQLSYLQSSISDVPLASDYANLIVSNCVFNLIEDKRAVFKEAFRLLKPGGRVVISDMIAAPGHENLSDSDYCACIGGATSIDEYLEIMNTLGFESIETIKEYEDIYERDLLSISYQSVLFVGYKPL